MCGREENNSPCREQVAKRWRGMTKAKKILAAAGCIRLTAVKPDALAGIILIELGTTFSIHPDPPGSIHCGQRTKSDKLLFCINHGLASTTAIC